jgi:hypothetical protein
MSRFSKLAAALAVVPVLAISGTALAGSLGQLAGGPGNTLYQVKNLTQKGAFASSISGTACNDELRYSMELSNTEFGSLTNVTLKATLPSSGGTSTATATTDLGGTSGTTSSVNVTLGSNQTQGYENGTTTLSDDKGNVIMTLPDTMTTSGVNVGTIKGSTTEFVNFHAKVTCPTTPPTAPPTTPPATTLPNTGAGDVLGIFAGASAAGTAAHAIVSRRRR